VFDCYKVKTCTICYAAVYTKRKSRNAQIVFTKINLQLLRRKEHFIDGHLPDVILRT